MNFFCNYEKAKCKSVSKDLQARTFFSSMLWTEAVLPQMLTVLNNSMGAQNSECKTAQFFLPIVLRPLNDEDN